MYHTHEDTLKELLSIYEEAMVSPAVLLEDLDRGNEKLFPIIRLWEKGEKEKAIGLLANHFRDRQEPRWFYDGRQGVVSIFPMPIDFLVAGYRWELSSEEIVRKAEELAESFMQHQFREPAFHVDFYMGDGFENVNPSFLWSHENRCAVYNRHFYVGLLCLCYGKTRKEIYAKNVIQFIEAWIEQRPFVVDRHIHSRSYHITREPDQEAMSLGFQMVNWICLLYSGVADHMSDGLLYRVIQRMWFVMLQYRRFDEDAYGAGNHHLFERGIMPLAFGSMFPEFLSISHLRDTGCAVVRRHIQRSIWEDGSSAEHSMAYSSYAYNMYVLAIMTGALNDVPLLREEDKKKLWKAYGYILQTIAPDGKQVAFGDGEPKRVETILEPLLSKQMEEVLEGTEIYHQAKSLWEIFIHNRDMGEEAALPPLGDCFLGSGFYFARDRWDPEAMMMGMALPREEVYMHGHQDPLSLQIYIHGVLFLGHPIGELYGRMGTKEWKKRIERGSFYNMTSQNCLLVHGHGVKPDEQLVAYGRPAPECTVEKSDSSPDGFYIRAYHEGYGFVRHTREAALRKGQGVLIQDTLLQIGEQESKAVRGYRSMPCHVQRWYLDYGVEVKKIEEAVLLLEKQGKFALLVWMTEEILWLDVHSRGHLPQPAFREQDPPVQMIDVVLESEESLQVGMVVLPLQGPMVTEKEVEKAKYLLQDWRATGERKGETIHG